MKEFSFTDEAFDEYEEWHNNKAAVKKMRTFIKEIIRGGPLYGSGNPEKLKYSDEYSREINEKDRFIYRITDGRLLIVSCKGHYKDH